MASTTTTVRVRTETRTALNRAAAADGSTADAIITAGLRALELESFRRQMEIDARRLRADPADRAAIAEALRGLVDE